MNDLNNSGQVVGGPLIGEARYSYIWDNGTFTNLGSLAPGFGSGADAINDLGQVVGSSGYSTYVENQTVLTRHHAFIWDKVNGMRDLGSLDDRDTSVYDINNSGLVIGELSGYDATSEQAFLWDSVNGMRALGPMGYPACGYPTHLNNLGQIVGMTTDSAPSRAAFWDLEGNVRYIDGLGTGPSAASGINDLGQVIGWMGDDRAPFLWDPVSGAHTLCPPSMTMAGVRDINNLGDIVGFAAPDNYTPRAALWSGGELLYLNDLIPEGTGIELSWAYETNDHGQIVACDGRGSFPFVYYLLTPIPEPSSLAALALALAGLCATRRRRRV